MYCEQKFSITEFDEHQVCSYEILIIYIHSNFLKNKCSSNPNNVPDQRRALSLTRSISDSSMSNSRISCRKFSSP